MSKLREVIEKEMGLEKGTYSLIDERGIDVTMAHADDLIYSENKK
jgi:hypothetical protein